MNEIPLTKTESFVMEIAPPCCDGTKECDGQSLLRLGTSFTPGDLALLSLSIPTGEWQHSPHNEDEAKRLRVWYVVVATDAEGEDRVLTGILTGEARQTLSRRIEADTIEQMEPIKFTPRNVCGGILHREAIRQRRLRLKDRKRSRKD